jgi:PST family polysaccharide transporter
MLKVFKHRLFGTEKKQLVENIFSLGILQGANYLLPLLTIPYLVRVLGPEFFGLLAFASATISYFMVICDYGFNLSATRQIAISRENNNKINEIFNSVMIIKIALLIFSFFILCFMVFSFDKFSRNWEVYLLTFGMVLGQILFPIWLFQGMEKMKFITYLSISAKIISTICIFIFVKNKSHFYYVPIFNSLGFLVVGLFSLFWARKEFNINFYFPSLNIIKFQLHEGLHIFLSSIAINLYTVSSTFFLGLYTNNMIVGYFAAADKIIQAVKGLYQPISQSIYPLIGKKIKDDKQAGLMFIKKISWLIGSGMFIISVLLFSFSETIITLLLGVEYKASVLLLQIMSVLPFTIAMSNILGIQIMLNLGFKKAFSRILLVAALLGVGLTLVTVPTFQELGSAITMVIIELFVSIVMYIFLKFNKII